MSGPGPGPIPEQQGAPEPAVPQAPAPPPPAAAPPPAAPAPAAPLPAPGPAQPVQIGGWSPVPVAAAPAAGFVYCDFTTRVIAYIIDAVILAVVFMVLNTLLVNVAFGFMLGYGGLILLVVLEAAITAGYFAYTWSTMGASPGQKVLKLQLVTDAERKPLAMNAAIRRWAVLAWPIVLAPLSAFGGFGLGWILSLAGLGWAIYLAYTTLSDAKRQGFHDKFVGSVVLKPAA